MAATFKTTRGQIPFEILGEYRERHSREGMSEVQMLCLVDWGNKDAFQAAVLPDVSLGPVLPATHDIDLGPAFTINLFGQEEDRNAFPRVQGFSERASRRKLIRLLPEPHPTRPLLYAVSAEVVDGVGYPGVTDAGTFGFFDASLALPVGLEPPTGKCRILVTFANLPYRGADVGDDATNAANSSELLRYVSRQSQFSAKNLPLTGQQFSYYGRDGGAPLGLLPESPVKTFARVHWSFTWHMIPAIPNAAFLFQSKVNRKVFDGFGAAAPEIRFDPTGIKAAAGTVAYISPEISKPYVTFGGTRVWDMTIHLDVMRFPSPKGAGPTFDRGHNFVYINSRNNFYRANTGLVFVPNTLFGDDRPNPEGTDIYDSVDITNLFRMDEHAITTF